MGIRNDGGSMPFAILAVTLLLASVAAAGVIADYQRASDNAGGVIDDIDAIDEAIVDVTDYINRGLGSIVRSISMDGDLGGMPQRLEEFLERTEGWMDFQFPMSSGGARVTYIGHDVTLSAEPMTVTTDEDGTGYIPTYLKGTGTVTVRVESQSGHCTTDLEVYTDGSYALPLSAERGSLFESMASGGGISLSQMMGYQLTSLAQYRILNGYGARSEYGTEGTDRILTLDDVQRAYEISLRTLEAICFRDGDGDLVGKGVVDPADLLVTDEGTIEIDLAAVYSQALMSALDEVLLRWVDYLYGFEVVETLDKVLNPFRNALDSLHAFLSGEERVSGVPYLQKVMQMNGYTESQYRYPGSGTTTVTAGGFTVSVRNPTVDLFDQTWLCDFKQRYEMDDEDYVRDYVLDILRNAALLVGERTDLGTVTIQVDPHDHEGFLDTMMAVFEGSVRQCREAIQDGVSSSLDDSVVYDEFYGSLADEVLDHAGSMVLDDELRASLGAAFGSAIAAEVARAEAEGREYVPPDVGTIMGSSEVNRAVSAYRSEVHRDLGTVGALKEVRAEGNLLKETLTLICSYGLDVLDVFIPVEERASAMAKEVLGINGTNPYGGWIDLPGSAGFDLDDGTGNIVHETLRSSTIVDLAQSSVRIDERRSTHTTGFREALSASYCTMFVVTIRGSVGYEVHGAGSMASAMGTESSVYKGEFGIDTVIEVPLATGWALAGVHYAPTDTILSDAWDLLRPVLEPMIEPLRVVLEAIRDAFTALAETLIEAAGFVSEQLMRLYDALMGPLEELKGMMEGFLQDIVDDAVFEILWGIGLDDQDISFHFFGCTLTFTTSAITWKSTTKSLLKAEMTMPVAGTTVSAGIDVKARGAVERGNLIITGFGGIEGDDWSVEAKLDPLMKSSRYLISMDGRVGDTKVSLVAPTIDNYCETGLALSDIAGIGEVIDNIPVPGLGVNIGLDAGFSLRYGDPQELGLIVNEYESNPEGTDKGNEWVELLNNGPVTIDLTGHTLIVNNGSRDQVMPLSGRLSPGEYMVVYPDYTLVNNSEKDTIRVLDAQGHTVDEVGMISDGRNDGSTCQRVSDGSVSWELSDGTMGAPNEGPNMLGFDTKSLKACVWEAVQRAFGKVPRITDLDTLASYLEYLVRFTLEEMIDTLAANIIDASVFAKVDVRDVTGTASGGMRVALRTDGELVKDGLRYVSGQVQSMVIGLKNPYRIDLMGVFTENIDLEVSFHAAVGFPGLLNPSGADLPSMDMNVIFRANIASLTRIAGSDTGDPGIEFGIMARDCPEIVVPGRLPVKDGMEHDLWLFRVTVGWK